MKHKFKWFYMNTALNAAELSHCVRARVGAVIVSDETFIDYGYNGTPSGTDNVCEINNKTKDDVIHAEINAICKVAKSTKSCYNAKMFITHEPCIECAKVIKQSGIKEVYFYHLYDSAKTSGTQFLKDNNVYVEQLI